MTCSIHKNNLVIDYNATSAYCIAVSSQLKSRVVSRNDICCVELGGILGDWSSQSSYIGFHE